MVVIPKGDMRLQYIQQGINAGLSGRGIQRSLRRGGLPISSRDTYDTIRHLKGVNKKAQGIKYIRKDYRPPESMFAKAQVYQRKKYHYQVKISGYNLSTDKWEETYRRVGSYKIRTKAEVEEFERTMLENIYYTNFEVTLDKAWKW